MFIKRHFSHQTASEAERRRGYLSWSFAHWLGMGGGAGCSSQRWIRHKEMGSHSHWFTSPLFHERRTSPMSGPSSGLQKNQDACRMKGEEEMSNSYKR